MRDLLLAAALCVAGLPAFAGGWSGGYDGTVGGTVVSCADLAGQHVAEGTSCLDGNGVIVVATEVSTRGTIFCPYPYRSSDSVFVNGSGYVLKDTVRASLGCL